MRWGAICYLNDAFAKRLREVRAAVDRLRPFYSDEAATRLWATGELMDQLRLQLDRSVALHRSAAYDANADQLKALFLVFRAGLVLLVLETAAWIVALADGA